VPGAYCFLDNKRMKVYESKITNMPSKEAPGTISKIDGTGIYINTLDYIILFTNIKIEGKKRCRVSEFINGINQSEFVGKVLK